MTNEPNEPSSNEKWWNFINYLWEMNRTGQRFWDHPKNEEDVLELKAHFEENCPNWKKGDGAKNMPIWENELPKELPF